MRVMSARLKEIRHQKQRGAASEAWRERRGVRTVTKPSVSLKKWLSCENAFLCSNTQEKKNQTQSSAVRLFISLTVSSQEEPFCP